MAKLLADEKVGVIQTSVTGQSLNLLRPAVEKLHIEDIAYSLSRLNRFTGYTVRPYSVAEHCLLGLDFAPAWDRFEWLMHDASEAFLGDVAGPLKALPEMVGYRELEGRMNAALRTRFGLKAVTPGSVKVVDQRMLVTEMRDLRGRRPMWGDAVKPYPMVIPAREPAAEMVEREFLEAFQQYYKPKG